MSFAPLFFYLYFYFPLLRPFVRGTEGGLSACMYVLSVYPLVAAVLARDINQEQKQMTFSVPPLIPAVG